MTWYVSRTSIALSTLALLLTSGCMDTADEQPAAATAPASQISSDDPPQPDPIPPSEPFTEEEIIAWAEQLVEEVYSGDDPSLSKCIDTRAMLVKATASPPDDPKSRAEFIRGGLQGDRAGNGLGAVIQLKVAEGGSYSFLRIQSVDGQKQALFRLLDPSGAVNYHSFQLHKQAGRLWGIDVYAFTAGEWYSQSLRRSYLQVAANFNRGWLDRLTGSESEFVKHIDDLAMLSNQVNTRQNAAALRTYDRLPETLKRDKTAMILRAMAAQYLDEAIYIEAINDFEKHHPNDPAMRLMLIDAYALRKDYPAARKAIDALDEMVGGDPYLHVMRGNLSIAQQDMATARDYFLRAIEEEPDLIAPYLSLLELAVQQEDHKETLRLLRVLSSELGLGLNDLTTLPEYAKFVESPQYQEWLEFQNNQ